MLELDKRNLGFAIGQAINIASQSLLAKGKTIEDLTAEDVYKVLEITQGIHQEITNRILNTTKQIDSKDFLIENLKRLKTREERLKFHAENKESFAALQGNDKDEIRLIFNQY